MREGSGRRMPTLAEPTPSRLSQGAELLILAPSPYLRHKEICSFLAIARETIPLIARHGAKK